jgi:ADP-heptose:LPS heptosyltransferase
LQVNHFTRGLQKRKPNAFYDMLAGWFGLDRVPVATVHAAFRARVIALPLPKTLVLPPRYVIVAPGCSEFGRERQLRPDEWRRLLASARLDGAAVVSLGGAADRQLCDAIVAELGHGASLAGQLGIAQSAGVLARAEHFFGIDSLLLHLARALGVFATSIWGPSDPAARLRPRVMDDRIYYSKMCCSPCIHVHETPPCNGARPCVPEALAAPPRLLSTVATGLAVGSAIGPDDRTAHSVEVTYD